ncbi:MULTISPECIES: amino acid adenylation domain-containing protein [unclassified Streptomyces]|uniref:non-ribosomal peptide synthetase n=1 Tax=unclassified Streptomyces TaxID=2593676 RepID=UPI0029AA93DB|nr:MULTISPECIES: amino acid adenylation domain-containing protein [unclassified Streptomyces]MDX3767882.1 amino acid adenylation domain-containing protein [Streptomyces sp. AK08-01B]MDX3818109.1 amino acid adenylation domain-containing protein [Streptomyces sp. AK08-01A]
MASHSEDKSRELTPIQQGLLFQCLQADGAYVDRLIVDLAGEINVHAFRRAWQEIVDRHAVLRTSFHWQDSGEPYQTVLPRVNLPFDVVEQNDLTAGTTASQEDSTDYLFGEEHLRTFDYASAPLVNATLVRRSPSSWTFLLRFSPLVMDGRSCDLAVSEFVEHYREFCRGDVLPPTASPGHRAYVELWRGREVAKAQAKDFWRTKLAGYVPPEPCIIGDPPDAGPGRLSHGAVERTLGIPSLDYAAFGFRDVGDLDSVLHGAWHLLLGRYGGRSDVLTGYAVTHRPTEPVDFEGLLGPTTLTLPVRTHIDQAESAGAWLRRVHSARVEAEQHLSLPLSDIQRLVAPDPASNWLESVFVPLQTPAPLHRDIDSRLRITRCTYDGRPRFPLSLINQGDGRVRLVYDRARYGVAIAERMLDHIQLLLSEMVNEPDRAVGKLAELPGSERKTLLTEWQRPDPAPSSRLIYSDIQDVARRTPTAVAVTDTSGDLTYRELEERSNQLAHHLLSLGADQANPVGVLMRRSRELLVALMAILKTGAPYVPLDPRSPEQRLELITRDSGARIVVTDVSLLGRLPLVVGVKPVYIDRDRRMVDDHPKTPPSVIPQADDLAYIMYTSGSTGRPKGVEVPHRGVVALLEDLREKLAVQQDTVWGAGTSCAFDISVVELFTALTVGGRVIVLAEDVVSEGESLGAALNRHNVTHFQATPSGWRLLTETGWKPNRPLSGITGGEALPDDLADDLTSAGIAPLWNAYGPTETSIWVTTHLVDARRPVPIGRAVGATRLYVLDSDRRLVPSGVTGELWVGGRAVTRGYRALPELTADRYRSDPFSPGTANQMYRTGDLVRWNSDGMLEFLGRNDEQIKLRGYRIELGEIEAVLRSHPRVSNAAAAVRPREAGDALLAAYVVTQGGGELRVQDIRDHMEDNLAPYMVPDLFVQVEALPLNSNGKLDRRALQDLNGHVQTAPASDGFATATEQRISELVAEVLHIHRAGRRDNLVHLGMHSLQAMRLAVRVSQQWSVKCTIQAIHLDPTISGIARTVNLFKEKAV